MKKAVIATGGKQYLVSEGETVDVELLKQEAKTVNFVPLLVVDGEKTTVGTPEIATAKVSAEVLEQETKDDKVISLRYKAKKRVHSVKGHRQRRTKLKIIKIA